MKTRKYKWKIIATYVRKRWNPDSLGWSEVSGAVKADVQGKTISLETVALRSSERVMSHAVVFLGGALQVIAEPSIEAS